MPLHADTEIMNAISILSDKLSERAATLFLGAGINANLKNAAGEDFPLGSSLSAWITRDLLEEEISLPLTESSEMAKYRLGDKAVNQYIHERFSTFSPGTAHLSLVQLPWDVIYTTNYDLLVEQAFQSTVIKPAGFVQPIFSSDRDINSLTENDIPYYKLHGCIDYANSPEGRLILTKSDYRFYETHRKSLFKRLKKDLLSRTFLFIGYSLTDDNFRATLDDCLQELDTQHLPLSFALRQNFSSAQETYWREKYNLQLLKADGSEFLQLLKTNWIKQSRSVIPLEQRETQAYIEFDRQTRFPKVAESFYKIDPIHCTGQHNANAFFRGAEPSWSDIRDAIMPQRDAYWTFLDAVFPELVDPSKPMGVYLITGAAGTGKTTLIYSIAYNLSKDFDIPVLIHIPGTPLDARVLAPLASSDESKRIVIIVRHAAEYIREIELFINEARQLKLPVSLILEERKNQWIVGSSQSRARLDIAEFEMGGLSDGEIDNILEALAKFDALGKLTETPIDYQKRHFRSLAHKELLVALRELTSSGNFDDIIRDEFRNIPSELARKAYVYVATLGQIDMSVRYEILIHILDLRWDHLRPYIFQPTEGILITGEESGRSRHDKGYHLSTRHPVIASVIFAEAAPHDEEKLEIINNLLAWLDPGHREDKRLLQAMVRRKELVSTLESPENQRAVFERLGKLLPDDTFVLQHRSTLERNLDNPKAAVSFARRAVSINKNNASLQNTLGLALELEARHTSDILRTKALLQEASKLFDDSIRRDQSDPFGYLGKYYVLRQQLRKERDPEKQATLKAQMFSLADEAYEATNESEVLANILAEQQTFLGKGDIAIQTLRAALAKDPTNYRVRDRLVSYLSVIDVNQALAVAMEGAQLDVTAWRIQRHVARLLVATGGNVTAIKGHYEAATRHSRSNMMLYIEYGAYLFKQGLYEEAKAIFATASQMPVGIGQKQMYQLPWKDARNHDVIFEGKVKSIEGSVGWAIATPHNFTARFWRNRGDLLHLRESQPIRFSVVFNAFGPQARVILDKK